LNGTGILLTNFTPGMSKQIEYQVTTVSCPNLGDTTITNTATVKADGVAPISDSATAILHVIAPVLKSVF